jgi:predicted ribosomally synthesized peptide with SipW-like signal peptide
VRRTTAWALGGMLAGTVLLGTGGTMATFSDTESLTATAGAGRLALVDPPAGGQQLKVGPNAGVLPVDLDIAGTGTAQLRLWAGDSGRGDPCAEPIVLTVTIPDSAMTVTETLCVLARTGVDLLAVDSTTPDLRLSVSASLAGDVGSSAQQWQGDLRLELVQEDGGFSDDQRVPLQVLVPNPQSENGTSSGNGNGKGNGNGNGSRD